MFYSMPNLNLLAKRRQSTQASSPPPSHDLLPSERFALSSSTSPPSTKFSLPSLPSTTTSSNDSTTTPLKKSRNDLFELDWSPVTPNVNSFTPPPPPPILPPLNTSPPLNENSWLEQSRNQPAIQIILPPTPPSHDLSYSSSTNNIPNMGSEINSMIPKSPTSPISPPPFTRTGSFYQPNFTPGQAQSQSQSQLNPLSFSKMEIDHSVPFIVPRSDSVLLEEVACLAGNSTNPILDSRQSPRLRLVPTGEYTLGEGRHATVYLASFIPVSSTSTSSSSPNLGSSSLSSSITIPSKSSSASNSTTTTTISTSSSSSHGSPESSWNLCAGKRVLPDRESQVAGLGEAFILSRLAVPSLTTSSSSCNLSNKNIITLYGVKDERDGIEPIPSTSTSHYPPQTSSSSYSNSPLLVSRKPSSSHYSTSSSKSNSRRNNINSTSSGTGNSTTPFGLKDCLPPLIGSPSIDLIPVLSFPDSSTIQFDSDQTSNSKLPSTLPLATKELKRKERGPRYSEPLSVLSPSSPSTSTSTSISKAGSGVIRSRSKKEDSQLMEMNGSSSTNAGGVTRRASGSQFEGQQAPSPSPSSTSHSSFATSQNQHLSFLSNPPPPPRIILLLEYCPFGTVLNFLKTWPERVGRRRWLICARELVGAVAWSHMKGVLHADIKPQNVLIAQDLSLRLSDFGLSRFISPSSPPCDPLGLGTPAYSPPEFVQPPPSPYSFPSDIFSLGVTLSVMISGHEAYEGMRTVERMFLVSKGGYYEWEERRRLGVIGSTIYDSTGGGGGSASVSRTGSMKSVTGGRILRNRPSAGGLGVSELGMVTNVLAGVGVSSNLSGGGRMRSDSLESCRSFLSTATGRGGGGGDRDSGDWSTRSSWVTAVLAQRLLKMDRNEDEDDLMDGGDGAGEGGGKEEIEIPSPETLLSFLPPPSPIDSNHHHHPDYFNNEERDSLGEEELREPIRRTTSYPLGTPYQYFLNGIDVVPLEIRELLRAMTSPRAQDRPTAVQALKILESLEF